MTQILFLGGPSGVGKTYFADHCLFANGWKHVPIDRPDGDGINLENLRDEWDAYFLRHDPFPLHKKLCDGYASHPKLVITFPGNCLFDSNHIGNARGLFHIFYLYGNPTLCYKAFLERSDGIPYPSKVAHWAHFNPPIYEYLSHPMNHWRLIDIFTSDGIRRHEPEIYADLEKLMGDVELPI